MCKTIEMNPSDIIFQKIGYQAEERIYEHFLGIHSVYPKLKIQNPILKEGNKTFCFFIGTNGKLLFKDFSPSRSMYVGDAIQAVRLKLNTNYSGALKAIDRDFQLGLYENHDYQKINKPKNKFVLRQPPKKKTITVIKRECNLEDLYYWNTFNILKKVLLRWVTFVKGYYVNETLKGISTPSMPLYGYKVENEHEQGWKIYNPKASSGGLKFYSNLGKNVVHGIIDKNYRSIFIASSVKDAMVIESAGYNAICFASEGTVPEKGLELLKEIPNVYILFDFDKAGFKATKLTVKKLSKQGITAIPIYLFDQPIEYPTDIAELSKEKGLAKIKETIWKTMNKKPTIEELNLDS